MLSVDTFEGFDGRDFAAEEKQSMIKGSEYLSDTSIELVKSKLPHSEMAEIRKGYFPESLGDLDDRMLEGEITYRLRELLRQRCDAKGIEIVKGRCRISYRMSFQH